MRNPESRWPLSADALVPIPPALDLIVCSRSARHSPSAAGRHSGSRSSLAPEPAPGLGGNYFVTAPPVSGTLSEINHVHARTQHPG